MLFTSFGLRVKSIAISELKGGMDFLLWVEILKYCQFVKTCLLFVYKNLLKHFKILSNSNFAKNYMTEV